MAIFSPKGRVLFLFLNPENWGLWIQFDEHIFSDGWDEKTTKQWWNCDSFFLSIFFKFFSRVLKVLTSGSPLQELQQLFRLRPGPRSFCWMGSCCVFMPGNLFWSTKRSCHLACQQHLACKSSIEQWKKSPWLVGGIFFIDPEIRIPIKPRWWQPKYVLFSPLLFGEMILIQFDSYFSDGLVQPPTTVDGWNPANQLIW